jgi:5S rRNA maturation endonuclease (ribonuclease M5)
MTRDDFIARNPIDDVLSRYGHRMVGHGNQRKVLCPFHADKNPSLSINIKQGTWFCHGGCGSGGVIDLIAKLDNKPVVEILKREGIHSNGYVDRKSVFANVPQKRFVNKAEKIGEAEIECTYSYRNERRREVYQSVRLKPKDFRQRHKKGDRWVWNLDGIERVLYNLPEVLAADTVWLCEGEKDADNLMALGFTATTSCGGSSSWLAAYANSLEGKHVALCGDNDDAGKEYIQNVFDTVRAKAETIRYIELPKNIKDVSDFIAGFKDKSEAKKALQGIYDMAHSYIKGRKILLQSVAEIQKSYIALSKDRDSKFDLGRWIPDLTVIRRLVPGDMLLIIGGTSVGKTALASSIAMATVPLPSTFFELELSKELLFERFIAAKYNMTCVEVEQAFEQDQIIDDAELDHHFKNLYICNETNLTIAEIEEQINQAELKIGQRPKVVLLDYIQLVQGREGSRYERLSDIAEELRKLAKRARVILIVLSQAQRPGEEDEEVTLFMGKGSGSLENSASVVFGIWRETNDPTLLYLRVLKNTKGICPQKRYRLNFDGGKMLITQRSVNMTDAVETAARRSAKRASESGKERGTHAKEKEEQQQRDKTTVID